MTNYKSLLRKYDDTHINVLLALHQQTEARQRAEKDAAAYREAFEWLEQQEWFKNNRHKLTAWLNSHINR